MKTDVFDVADPSGKNLGLIKWAPRFRYYVYWPENEPLGLAALQQISAFIENLMTGRKKPA